MDMEVEEDAPPPPESAPEPAVAPAPAASANGPSQTVYIRNLNEKIKRRELRSALYSVFTRYGKVLDIVASKTLKMRGQAFVVYGDVNSATAALRAMQGSAFFGKPMVLQFAKDKSDCVAKIDGTYVPREKRSKVEAAREEAQRKAKAKRKTENGEEGPSEPPTIKPDDSAPPNKILFVQNLPPASDAAEISQLFKQFAGFGEVRVVPGNAGIAFVEFSGEPEATMALSALQSFKYLDYTMTISYAKQG